jgi:hypothetical protein
MYAWPEFLSENKRRTYEISSFDCCFDGSHWHSDGNAAHGRAVLQRQKVLQH